MLQLKSICASQKKKMNIYSEYVDNLLNNKNIRI